MLFLPLMVAVRLQLQRMASSPKTLPGGKTLKNLPSRETSTFPSEKELNKSVRGVLILAKTLNIFSCQAHKFSLYHNRAGCLMYCHPHWYLSQLCTLGDGTYVMVPNGPTPGVFLSIYGLYSAEIRIITSNRSK